MVTINKLIQDCGLEYFNRYYGIYKGFVHDNDDPDNLGRLQIIVPKVYGNTPFRKWAVSKGIYSGKKIGSFWMPNKEDTVWVSFEGGDCRFPVWEYGHWMEGQVPRDASVQNKVLQTTSGHRLEFSDIKDEELIRIQDKHGNFIELNKNGVSIVTDSISLGSLDESAEPAVMGDTAVGLLNEFIADIGALDTIITSAGVTSKISTSPQWSPLVSKWKQKWKEFNSNVVTLDKD